MPPGDEGNVLVVRRDGGGEGGRGGRGMDLLDAHMGGQEGSQLVEAEREDEAGQRRAEDATELQQERARTRDGEVSQVNTDNIVREIHVCHWRLRSS